MKVDGKSRLMKQAVCFARALGVFAFELVIVRGERSSCEQLKDGTFIITIEEDIDKYWQGVHLAHEMTHLRQFKHDELIHEKDHIVWKGQKFHDPEPDSEEYWLAPWEMEARAMEAWLMHKWETQKRELH